MKRLAGTFLSRITHIAARAGIHRTNEHKSGWIHATALYTIDRDNTVFERLTKSLKNSLWKFKHFIEEKYSFVSQGNLARLGVASSADD